MKEIVIQSKEELGKLLKEKREALRIFRFSIAGGKAKNVKEGNNLKKEIARILTKINQK